MCFSASSVLKQVSAQRNCTFVSCCFVSVTRPQAWVTVSLFQLFFDQVAVQVDKNLFQTFVYILKIFTPIFYNVGDETFRL